MKATDLTYGDIVLIYYPFSDLRTFKKRPCIIVKELGEDVLVIFVSSQISKKAKDDVLVKRDNKNNLAVDSLIKVWKINTIHKGLIVTKIGTLGESAKAIVKERLMRNLSKL